MTRASREQRELFGEPCSSLAGPFLLLRDRMRFGPLGTYVGRSRRIPGWNRDAQAIELAKASYALPDGAIVLEHGCLLGCSTVLLAGARVLRGSGEVHVVDPLDASGDAFSAPVYRAIAKALNGTLRSALEANLRRSGVADRVVIHQGLGHEVAATWKRPLDMLVLDGDHSPEGARLGYAAWSPFLKAGGLIAVHNSTPMDYQPDHDGSHRIVGEFVRAPWYDHVRSVGTGTFAVRTTAPHPAI
ncbi:MAG TPA: class I SAM-dependent methyltransferase [Thermoleophilia bacterium]|nr:class I SAM-dependent methyltransferase [Thermoleophilia bacterium]